MSQDIKNQLFKTKNKITQANISSFCFLTTCTSMKVFLCQFYNYIIIYL